MSWPLARQNSQWVPLEDWEVGGLEFIRRGAVNAAIGGCGDGVANTWSEDEMWWVGRRFSSEMSSLTTVSREGVGDRLSREPVSREEVGDRLSREAQIGSKSSRKPIMKCIHWRWSQYLTKSSMSLEHTSGGFAAESYSHIVEVWE